MTQIDAIRAALQAHIIAFEETEFGFDHEEREQALSRRLLRVPEEVRYRLICDVLVPRHRAIAMRIAGLCLENSAYSDAMYLSDIYLTIQEVDYSILVLVGTSGMDPDNDNVDVEVRFNDTRRYMATFMTLNNVRHLFEKNKVTGECARGTYLYCTDLILVEQLTEDVIKRTVADLIREHELDGAFTLVDNSA